MTRDDQERQTPGSASPSPFAEPGHAASSASRQQAETPTRASGDGQPSTPPRKRTKKPTNRIRFAVRIDQQLNARLTYACEKTGGGPQHVIEIALNAYFEALGIPAVPPVTGERPVRERTPKKRNKGHAYLDLVPIGIRLLPLTDARLTYACEYLVMGPQDMVGVALNAHFMRLGIPLDAAPGYTHEFVPGETKRPVE
ncbi:hypothetical protein [Streptosporangium saharense]|uniref:hypothetical protein n=1 Tax=Streptosporangium saharense TaxID=1706840 RepID=UPI003422AF8F